MEGGLVLRRIRELIAEMSGMDEVGTDRGGGRTRGSESVAEGCTEGDSTAELGWEAPRAGVAKINVDAGLIAGLGVGWGLVCRNSQGSVEWCVASQTSVDMEPKFAEAMAILHGAQEARRAGIKHVIFESDCLSVVEDLRLKKHGRSDIHLVYLDILSTCLFFDSFSFSFVRRKLNAVAHSLTHLYPWFEGRRAWSDDFPPDVVNLVQKELIVMA
ncbi:uncharacterized protein LOC141620280 [Silene latifolia]|uniref:uncharacterized protein LOC141620280 n=1 Tax=Silene latifolia TaxID=37657 RepID=UPI003D76A6A5